MRLRLRGARWEDRRLLFDWANDPEVRSRSFQPEPIAWEVHLEWLAARLADPAGTRIFIAEHAADGPVGQIRFSRAGPDAVIGYSVAAGHRGMRHGTRLLERGCRRILACWPDVSQVTGEVKRENAASVRAFERAGFEECGHPSGPARYVWRPQSRRFVIATGRSWMTGVADRLERRVAGSFHWATVPTELDLDLVRSPRPSYVFFLSSDGPWTTSRGLADDSDCVLFDVGDLEGGRLRKLEGRRRPETRIVARSVRSPLERSEVLLGRPLSLDGTEEDIFARAAGLIEEMIQEIIERDLGGGPPPG